MAFGSAMRGGDAAEFSVLVGVVGRLDDDGDVAAGEAGDVVRVSMSGAGFEDG